MKRFYYFLIIVVYSFSSYANTGVQTSIVCAENWTLYVPDWRTEHRTVTLLPASSPLENYAANLERLEEILPDGKAVWKGGGFDIEPLTYTQSVWQTGNGNCCPSGGRIDMQLAIEDYQLVIKETSYELSPLNLK